MNYSKTNNVTAYSVLIFFASVLTFFIIYNANWLVEDDFMFLRTTVLGKTISSFAFTFKYGRFFPLALCDYNILLLIPFGTTATSHYIWMSCLYLFFIFSLYILFKKIYEIYFKEKGMSVGLWIVVTCILYMAAKFYSMYYNVIYPERITLILMSLFIYFSLLFNNTEKWKYGIPALIFAAYMSYCKEPISGALFVFALANYLFAPNKSKKKKLFYWLLFANFFIFISLYYFVVFKDATVLFSNANAAETTNLLTRFIKIMTGSKILLPAIIFALFRFYKIVIKHEKEYIFFDGLLFAGIAYFGALFLLNLTYTYYYYIVILMVFPSLIFHSLRYFSSKYILVVTAVLSLFFVQKQMRNIPTFQKNRTEAYEAMCIVADYVKNGYQLFWYETDLPQDTGVRDWRKEAVSSYIDYLSKASIQISDISEPNFASKTVILYPDENNSNGQEADLFFEYVQKDNLQLKKKITGISIYVSK